MVLAVLLMKTNFRRWVFVCCLSCAIPVSAQAAARYWNASAGDWDEDPKWNPTSEPTTSDEARVENAGTVTVTQASEVYQLLRIGDVASTTGSVAMSSGSLSGLPSGDMHIGFNGTGTFTQNGGSNSAQYVTMGFSSSGKGAYALSGGKLVVAQKLTVAGSGKALFSQSGGTNQCLDMRIGESSGGNGTNTITVGKLIVGNLLQIGSSDGYGRFNLNGGTVVTKNLEINATKGTFTSSGAGILRVNGITAWPSTFSLNVFLQLGHSSVAGILGIGSGRALSVSKNFTVGFDNDATLTQDGGTITVTEDLILGETSAGNGTYNFTGGTLQMSSGRDVAIGVVGTGILNIGDASSAGTVSSASADLNIGTKGTVRGWSTVGLRGTLDNSGTVKADGYNYGTGRTLDLSSFTTVANAVNNPDAGSQGWFAQAKGRLVLPSVPVALGNPVRNWGEDPADTDVDLVNSLRLAFSSVSSTGVLVVALLATNFPPVDVAKFVPIGVWKVDTAGGLAFSSVNMTFRYNHVLWPYSEDLDNLRIFRSTDGANWVSYRGDAIDATHHRITLNGVANPSYFALGKVLPPEINHTDGPTNIGITNATLRATLTKDGGEPCKVTFFWGDNNAGTGPWDKTNKLAGTFSATAQVSTNITGLIPGTKYYYRAFASNSANTVWSGTVATNFTTLAPVVSNKPPSNVQSTTATLNGRLDDAAGGKTWYLVIYHGSINGGALPGTWAKTNVVGTASAATDFHYDVTGLTPGSTYYYRAAVTNTIGKFAANTTESFTVDRPSVATWTAQNVKSSSADFRADVGDTGGETCKVYFYWDYNGGGENVSDWLYVRTKNGVASPVTIVTNVTGLIGDTTVYYRTAISNSGGLFWSTSGTSFLTDKPAVTTVGADLITSSSARFNGNVTSLGGETVCKVYFYWDYDGGGTSPGEWLYVQTKQNVTATGGISTNITGLTVGATVYYRTAVSNAGGLFWSGSGTSFTVDKPVVSTLAADEITSTSGRFNANVTDTGSETCTVWFYWGNTSGGDSRAAWAGGSLKVENVTGIGTQSATLSGQTAGEHIYYRAAISNSGGFFWAAGETDFFIDKPAIARLNTLNVTSSSADFRANVTDTGGETCKVYFYWDYDGGDSNVAQWAYVKTKLNVTTSGTLVTNATGLTPGNTVHYRTAISNSGGLFWSPSGTNFVVGKPVISSLAAVDVKSSMAKCRANLTDLGYETCTVWFFWGDEDRVTDAGLWDTKTRIDGQTQIKYVTNSLTGLAGSKTYYYRPAVSNSGGLFWSDTTINFTTDYPQITTQPEQNVKSSMADLYANLTDTGQETCKVFWYYGTSDKGTNAGDWDAFTFLSGETVTGTKSKTLTGLHGGTPYYFRAAVSNAGGLFWSGSGDNFTTDKPEVSNVTATNIVYYTAQLRGSLDDTGQETCHVRFHYGLEDKGANASQWAHVTAYAGGYVATRTFTNDIGSLLGGRQYFYRAAVSNAGGLFLATSSGTFWTRGPSDFHVTGSSQSGNDIVLSLHAIAGRSYKIVSDETFNGAYSSVRYSTSSAPGDFNYTDTGVIGSVGKRYYKFAEADIENASYYAYDPVVWGQYNRGTSAGEWYKLSIPIDYGAANRLDSTLGAHLASGLAGGGLDVGDLLYLPSGGGWNIRRVNGSGTWVIHDTGVSATDTVDGRYGLWLKRRSAGGADTEVFTGPVPASAQAVTFPGNQWTLFGWPLPTAKSEGQGWGFTSGTKGTSWMNADRLIVGTGAGMTYLYLNTDGRWYVPGGTSPASGQELQPGEAYYYYHRGSGSFNWTPTP